MNRTISGRLIAPAIGALVIGLLLEACSDKAVTSTSDDWAERAVVATHVRSVLTAVDGGAHRRLQSNTSLGSAVVMPSHRVPAIVNAQSRDVRIIHFRDAKGTLHSVGALYDGSGQPPRFIYAFENGRIRAVFSSTYRPHGKGWLRDRTRVTYFDSTGNVRLQVDSKPELGASNRLGPIVKSARDALAFLLPSELHAEEGACTTEKVAYAAASWVVATATTALLAAAAGCPETGVTCLSLEAATAAVLSAITAWNVALDKLAACLEKAEGATSSGGGTTQRAPTDGPLTFEQQQSVRSFIDDSIASGNYKCDSGGSCTYYGAT